MKICTLCEVDQPTANFRSDRGAISARCKKCRASGPRRRARLVAEKIARDEAWLAEYDEKKAWETLYEWRLAPEKWMPVPGYRYQYEVSDQGRVRSLWYVKQNQYWRWPVPKILTHYTNALGYQSLTLIDWHTGDKTTLHIHTLVLTAFKGERPSDRHVGGHRDGNPSNNKLSNLDWITFEENEADKMRHGRTMTGAKNHQAKLNEDQVREMRLRRAAGATLPAIASEFGISTAVAHKIVTGKAWKHV